MATNLAASQREIPRSEAQVDTQMHQQDQSYLKYFVTAAIFLLVSGLHAFIWRLPPVEQWVRGAGYGGRMATTLAQTHITVVAFGTITVSGIIYYLLPRILAVPLASKALATVSFWCTAFGVFAFYIAYVIMGVWEGNLVHEGYTYYAARFALNGWHQGLLGFSASIMGIGYWTFIWNVIATVRAGVRRRQSIAATAEVTSGASDITPKYSLAQRLGYIFGLGNTTPLGSTEHYYITKFIVVAVIGLFIGTVQGVIQVIPFFVEWKEKTAEAGNLFDPISHAHINLVGGLVFAMMAFSYYFLPKITGKPIHSRKLANFSFRFLVVGVFGFYVSLITLSLIEGNMMIAQNITAAQARSAVGAFHPLALALSGTLMGIGFWTYIGNIFLTLADKRDPSVAKPPYEWLTPFIGISTFALLCGTIQGVIQTLPIFIDWMESSGDAGEFISPLAHAQLNTVGAVVILLATYSLYLIPQIVARPLFSIRLARTTLSAIAIGAGLMYLGFFILGIGMSGAMQQGYSFADAINIFPGNFLYYVILISGPAFVGIGYLLYAANVFATIGRSSVAVFFGRVITALSRATSELVTVYHRALPKSVAQARSRALTASGAEIILPGAGWFISGRPKMGAVLLLTGTGILFSTVMVIFVMYDRVADIPYLQVLITYILFTVASSVVQYLTYMSQARNHLAARAAARLAPTRTTAEASQSQVVMSQER